MVTYPVKGTLPNLFSHSCSKWAINTKILVSLYWKNTDNWLSWNSKGTCYDVSLRNAYIGFHKLFIRSFFFISPLSWSGLQWMQSIYWQQWVHGRKASPLHAFIHSFKPMGNVVSCFWKVGREPRGNPHSHGEKLHRDRNASPVWSHGWIFQNNTEAHVYQQTHKQSPSVRDHAFRLLSPVLLHLLQLLVSIFRFILGLHQVYINSADCPLYFKQSIMVISQMELGGKKLVCSFNNF